MKNTIIRELTKGKTKDELTKGMYALSELMADVRIIKDCNRPVKRCRLVQEIAKVELLIEELKILLCITDGMINDEIDILFDNLNK